MEDYKITDTDIKENEALRKAKEERFYEIHTEIIKNTDYIKDELYIKNDVKRGLRNADGTGVVVGLTRVGQVVGYDYDENGNKIPTDGKLYYRGYDVEELVQNLNAENSLCFE